MTTVIPAAALAVPVAGFYCGLGAFVGASVFNKLSHIAEYTLNKTFGDYQNLKRTLDNKIIVSMPIGEDYYYIQNVVLAVLVAAISSKAVQILILAGCPSIITSSLLVGGVAAPILFSLMNMMLRGSGGHHGRWVEISNPEIDINDIEKIHVSVRAYCGFGSEPEFFPAI